MVKLIHFCLTWNVWCAAVSPVTQHGLSEVAGDMWWYVGWVKVCKSQMVSIIKWKVITEDVYSFQCHSDSEVACCFAPLFYSSGDHAACRFRRVAEPCAAESKFRAFWPWAAWSKHTASQRNATSNVQACRNVGFVLCHLVNSVECGLHFFGCQVNSQEKLWGEIMTCNRCKATLSHISHQSQRCWGRGECKDVIWSVRWFWQILTSYKHPQTMANDDSNAMKFEQRFWHDFKILHVYLGR